MSLSAGAMRDLRAIAELFGQKPRVPAVSACEEHAATLASPGAAPDLPPISVLEALRLELQSACATSGALTLRTALLRRAPMVFWHGKPQAAGFPGLMQAFLLAARERPRWLRPLIEAWLRDFGPDRIELPSAGRAVGALLPFARDPRLELWLAAHRRFDLFDADVGPRNVSRALLQDAQEPAKILEMTGMNDPSRAEGGYFRAVLRALLDRVPDALRSPTAGAAWRRAAGLLEVQSESRDRLGRLLPGTRLRFANQLTGDAARAALAPWLTPPGAPHAPREEIKAFLVRNLGDPRIKPNYWEKAGPDATSLMCSWLASESLEAFLSFISKNADDGQWQYRQKFWRACLKKMPSAQVWVIFGEQLAVQARAMRDLQGFGHMHGPGMVAQQAVLLVQLGNLVLSEWSNVGPVRAWDKDDRRCPRPYEATYNAAELRTPCLDFPNLPHRGHAGGGGGKGLWHRGGEDGLWQGRAAELLRQRLGLVLAREDYM